MGESSSEEIVDETINAYRVQRLEDGRIRIDHGGVAVHGETLYEAMIAYGEFHLQLREAEPGAVDEMRRKSIHDGNVPLRHHDSGGFTPEEILMAVTDLEEGHMPGDYP